MYICLPQGRESDGLNSEQTSSQKGLSSSSPHGMTVTLFFFWLIKRTLSTFPEPRLERDAVMFWLIVWALLHHFWLMDFCLFGFFLQNQVKNVNEVTGLRMPCSLFWFLPFCSLVVAKRICLSIPMVLLSIPVFHFHSQLCYLSPHLLSPWDYALH